MTRESKGPSSQTRTLGLLLVVAIAPSLGTLAALWWWKGAIGGMVYASCKVVLYGVPLVVAWRPISKSQVKNGIRSGLRRGPLLAGFGSGLLIFGVVLVGWFGFLQDRLDTSALMEVVEANGLRSPGRYLAMALWMSFGNALAEEFVFRWFVDSRLEALGVPLILAVPLSALIFTAHHVLVLAAYFGAVETILFSLGVFVGGVLWSLMLRRWGSILPGWISHALVDLVIFLVGWTMLFSS